MSIEDGFIGRGVAALRRGKNLRRGHDLGRQPPHLLSAILHQEGLTIGQLAVDEKTNEIQKLPELLAPMPQERAAVTADTMHTQRETTRHLVENNKADYLLIVEDNQANMRRYIAPPWAGRFSPW
ncbi:MAG: hypothetical protein AB1641_29825 [Thermodesulfobacteriota bacterium]